MFLQLFSGSLVVSAISYTVILQFLRKHLSRENFRGRKVPAGSGLILLVTYVLIISYYVFFQEKQIINLSTWLLPLTILIIVMGALGFIDDAFGKRGVGGFRGHFTELAKGRLTTGVLKAIGGGIVCLIVAHFYSENMIALAVNGALMALLANIFNLLDLRPGRALKLFLILGIVIFLFSFKSTFWVLASIFLGVFVILSWADLSESCMLGDVGSNVLGAVIGFSMVANFTWVTNAVALILIVIVQLYAESHSISEFIDGVPILKALDKFGRRKERRPTVRRQRKMIMR